MQCPAEAVTVIPDGNLVVLTPSKPMRSHTSLSAAYVESVHPPLEVTTRLVGGQTEKSIDTLQPAVPLMDGLIVLGW